MLTSLSIRDVVLIDKLSLDFEEGLSVFTGETGAGKSIFLDSLSLALGARAEASLVRKGEESLAVSAGFKGKFKRDFHIQISIHQNNLRGRPNVVALA